MSNGCNAHRGLLKVKRNVASHIIRHAPCAGKLKYACTFRARVHMLVIGPRSGRIITAKLLSRSSQNVCTYGTCIIGAIKCAKRERWVLCTSVVDSRRGGGEGGRGAVGSSSVVRRSTQLQVEVLVFRRACVDERGLARNHDDVTQRSRHQRAT